MRSSERQHCQLPINDKIRVAMHLYLSAILVDTSLKVEEIIWEVVSSTYLAVYTCKTSQFELHWPKLTNGMHVDKHRQIRTCKGAHRQAYVHIAIMQITNANVHKRIKRHHSNLWWLFALNLFAPAMFVFRAWKETEMKRTLSLLAKNSIHTVIRAVQKLMVERLLSYVSFQSIERA